MTPCICYDISSSRHIDNSPNSPWKNTYWTRNDLERLRSIRHRWQNEQQLNRKKYNRIAHENDILGTVYASKRCQTAPTYITSKADAYIQALLKRKQSPTNYLPEARDNLSKKRQTKVYASNGISIPPMYCFKCKHHLTECSCPNGLGQWWITLQQHQNSTEKTSQQSSTVSLHKRHVHFDWKSMDFSSIKRTDSESTISSKKLTDNMLLQFILLDRDNRQSLIDFIRTTMGCKQNLSHMTIEQLRKLITDNSDIRMYHSITELILAMNSEQRRSFFCHVYIDPLFYSHTQDTMRLSRILADNIDLTQTLESVQIIASILGARTATEVLPKRETSIQQRKTTLGRQSLHLAARKRSTGNSVLSTTINV